MLKPGGRFSCSEWARTWRPPYLSLALGYRRIGQLPRYASDDAPSTRRGGLRISEEIDLSDPWIAFLKEMRVRAERGDPPLNANHVIMGDDIGERIKNAGRCAMENAWLSTSS